MSRHVSYRLITIGLLLSSCAGLSSCTGGAGRNAAAGDFSLKDLDGKAVSLTDLRGKPVVVVFWAVGCGPCRQEVPILIRMQERYRDKGLVIVAPHVWSDREPPEMVKQFVSNQGINYRVLLNGDEVAQRWGVSSIPTAFYLDREGRVAAESSGAESQAEIEAKMQRILGAPGGSASGG